MIEENNILFRKPPLLGPPLSLPEKRSNRLPTDEKNFCEPAGR